MSDDGVYGDDMKPSRFSDHDVELLLAGRIPEDESLARLAPILEAMKREHLRLPDEQIVTELASDAARIAAATSAARPSQPARRRMSGLMSNRRFIATAAGFALVLGMTGVAAASDEAVPGDPLYGVDRTLESVGIGSGGPAERISEARVLLDGGMVPEAIAHAAEAVEEGPAEDVESAESSLASEALRGAAQSVAESSDAAGSQEVRDSVAAMLTEMADMIESGDSKGADFGRRVADMAHGIQGGDDDEDEAAGSEPGEDTGNEGEGTSEDGAAGPPQGTPGPPNDDPDGPPGTTPPARTPPGSTPPGSTPPGTTPSGSTPPGSTPPGNGPPGNDGPPGGGPPGNGGPPGGGPPEGRPPGGNGPSGPPG